MLEGFALKLYLVDTFSLLFKFYYHLQDLRTAAGTNTAWLSAFVRVVQQVYKLKGDHVVFALESKENKRKSLCSTYKAKRIAPPGLEDQLPIILEWMEKMGLDVFSVAGYESDDVIASLCSVFAHAQVRILSADKDFYQLVSPRVFLCDPSTHALKGVEECLEKYGIYPHQFVDYQGLIGDSSDGYKGVEGIGPTYGAKLIQAFGTLENLYHTLETKGITQPKLPAKLQHALLRDKEQAFLSRQLATLHTTLFSQPPTLQPFPQENPLLRITDALQHYEMFALLKQINPTPKNPPQISPSSPQAPQQILARLLALRVCAIALEPQGLLGILGLEPPSDFILLNLHEAQAQACLQALYRCKLIGYQIKEVFLALNQHCSLDLPPDYEDVALLAWLHNSNLEPKISALAKVLELEAFESKPNAPLDALALERNTQVIAAAYAHYQHHLSPALLELGRTLEYPLLEILYRLQVQGFRLDLAYFQALQQEFKESLQALQSTIHTLARTPLNVNSTKQWAHFLYQHLGLQAKGVKKIKTGFSTDEASLKALQETYQNTVIQGVQISALLDALLQYREIFKLQTTYVEPLLTQNQHGKIHSIFYQNTTASSRLSSAHPNLQNIPIRTPLGKKIAHGFIPSAPDLLLLGVDYSQIELRLLAHFSGDAQLIQAFLQGQDIHLNTALALFNDPSKRHAAKSINFALLYGMGPQRLAQTLKISQAEAKSYIEHYFNTFPTIKDFLENLKARILQEHQITTLLGHQRHFDFTHANPKLQAEYLREGVNTLFQGSASDLVKLAMLKIHAHIAPYPRVKMLVQVHDEILLEVPHAHAPRLASEIKTLMETIYPLKIPLECHTAIAPNWGDLKGL
ncbi:DNA polymerase [Helicobacter vulpis]|uniref:DNA polymerase n=1 Tax=Helicobacter vulpis TaxID=2316076 RepID=UPI000EAC72D5|nr:DNA polymerase [Helicobacter vulpis]